MLPIFYIVPWGYQLQSKHISIEYIILVMFALDYPVFVFTG